MTIQQRARSKQINKLVTRVLLVFAALSITAAYFGFKYYSYIFAPNVINANNKNFLYITTGSDYEDVLVALEDGGFVNDINSFKWVADKKSYSNNIKPGRYLLKNDWSNNDVVNTLRSGNQTAIKVTFNNIRTMRELAGAISQYLECDSAALLEALNNEDNYKTLGFTKETAPAMFIPNTYELWWNTSPENFIKRMHKEYNKFWTDTRKQKAKEIGLTPSEVSTLAAIVDEETVKSDEKPKVAGLYINRLNKNIRLQADPTVKYAIGDFGVQRILTKDLKTESPYNTYLHAGLPPGPIRVPSVEGIEAVLNYAKHNYLYMCAKEDFSGYHNFATTLKQHNINARKFQRALNKNRIYR